MRIARVFSHLSAAFLALAVMIDHVRERSILELLFGCISTVECTLRPSGGGMELAFQEAAIEALSRGTRVIINDECASACVIFASLVRARACLTPSAVMMVHRASVTSVYDPDGNEVTPEDDPDRYLNPPEGYEVVKEIVDTQYGVDIDEWLARERKLPAFTDDFYTLTREETLLFWKPCG